MSSTTPRPIVTGALVGGLAAGLIDIVYAILINGAAGVSSTVVLQSVSSGLLGVSAYNGGVATSMLGILLHFMMTIGMALVFILLARKSQILRRNLLTAGLAYGAIIYFAMRWVVVPLSRFPGDLRTFDLSELLVHVIGVGLVIALAAERMKALGNRPIRTGT